MSSLYIYFFEVLIFILMYHKYQFAILLSYEFLLDFYLLP